MSDKLRFSTAVLLLTVCIAMCMVPALNAKTGHKTACRSRGILETPLNDICMEVNGTICVNTAETEELTELYGIGETLAALIVSERQKNGPYYYAEDLEAVRGIGPATLGKFRDMIDLTAEERGR